MNMSQLMPRRQVSWSPSHTTRAPLVLVARMAFEPRKEGGEPSDFGEVAKLLRPLLERVALRLSGNPENAKDLVQETLLRGLLRYDPLRHSNAAAWLTKILTNLFFDYLKHQKVVTRAEPELAGPEAEDIDDDSGWSRIHDEQIRAAVQALEPELREVVELCYLKQMRYREVAAVLNLPMGTIGTRLMRARERLRELLESRLGS
jgi:RNA polymerase sigma-70 factor, ECF subfamily